MAESDRSRDVAKALLQSGAVILSPHEPVTFKSGLRSPVYVDSRRLIFQPGPWHVVIEAFGAEDTGAAVVAGVESAGIPHSSALAYASHRPSVFVRKAPKDHGLVRRIEGGDVAGRQVVLVEDMVTTGSSSLSAVAALRDAGAVIDTCLAIITYGFAATLEAFSAAGVSLRVLTTFETVLDEAIASGSLEVGSAQVVRAWLADPHGWQAP